MTQKILVAFLFTISLSTFSQTTTKTKEKTKLTYYYVGDGCPFCINDHPEKNFGFLIKCIGCVMTDSTERHNKSVIQKLDKRYGQGWTLNYVKTMCDNLPLNDEDKKIKTN